MKNLRELIPNNLDVFKDIFSSLRSRNYRLYFSGQCISLIGTWMQQIAMSWLVYRLTGSVLLLGLVSFCAQIPTFILSPIAGVISDRIDRLKILKITQACAMLESLALAVLVLTGAIATWHIIALSIFVGLVNAFDTPARQSLVIDLVDKKENLGNAIALNSAIFNGARLIGPSVAGILIAIVGEGICFLINGLSYIAVLGALYAIRLNKTDKPAPKEKVKVADEMKAGVKYAFGFMPIRTLLILLAVISFTGMPFIVLIPAFAKDVLGGDSHTLGFMMGSVGAGALVAALYLAARKSIVGLGKVISLACALFGTGLIVFSFLRINVLVCFVLIFVGFGMIATVASVNTMLQSLVDDDKRGRIMGLYAMALSGINPLGCLLAGALGDIIGVPYVILAGGVVCVLAAWRFERWRPLVRRMSRPIFVRKGMIKEIAIGIDAAKEIK